MKLTLNSYFTKPRSPIAPISGVQSFWFLSLLLNHWGRVTHISVSKLTTIGSDNGLLSGRRQAIIWTNAGILLIWPLGTNFDENLIEIDTFSFTKMHLKTSSGKWRPFCLGLNVLIEMTVMITRKYAKYAMMCHHWPAPGSTGRLRDCFGIYDMFNRQSILITFNIYFQKILHMARRNDDLLFKDKFTTWGPALVSGDDVRERSPQGCEVPEQVSPSTLVHSSNIRLQRGIVLSRGTIHPLF